MKTMIDPKTGMIAVFKPSKGDKKMAVPQPATDTKLLAKFEKMIQASMASIKSIEKEEVTDMEFQGFSLLAILSTLQGIYEAKGPEFLLSLNTLALFYVMSGTKCCDKDKLAKMPDKQRKKLEKAKKTFELKVDSKPGNPSTLTLSRMMSALAGVAVNARLMAEAMSSTFGPSAGVVIPLTDKIIFDDPILCSQEGIYLIPSSCSYFFLLWQVWAKRFNAVVSKKSLVEYKPSIAVTKWQSQDLVKDATRAEWFKLRMDANKMPIGAVSAYAFDKVLEETYSDTIALLSS
jgi:hypothetical protein